MSRENNRAARIVERKQLVEQVLVERAELLELCRNLTPAEWEAESLCQGWRVRDVVAHIIGEQQDGVDLFFSLMSVEKFNARSVARRKSWTIEQLIENLEKLYRANNLTKMLPALFLEDTFIHQQDIRYPLNRPRSLNPDHMRNVLPMALKQGSKRWLKFRIVAEDIGLELGPSDGPELHGPAEALIMTVSGRKVGYPKLSGSGVEQLKR